MGSRAFIFSTAPRECTWSCSSISSTIAAIPTGGSSVVAGMALVAEDTGVAASVGLTAFDITNHAAWWQTALDSLGILAISSVIKGAESLVELKGAIEAVDVTEGVEKAGVALGKSGEEVLSKAWETVEHVPCA